MWKSIPRQPRENSSCEKSIKQNARLAVKLALSSLAFILFAASPFGPVAHSEEETPPPPESEALPNIEAKIRHFSAVKSSTSGRVYLIDLPADQQPAAPQDSKQNPKEEKPPLQKILLIRNGDENIMALRVLRDITGTSQVIVKKIKQYGDRSALTIGQTYYALEKLSDSIPPPPSPQDKADMAEVEPPPLAFDPDLDMGSSPSPNSDDESNADDSRANRLGASIEEKLVPFEKHKNWISLAVGTLRNTPDSDAMSGKYYAAGGIRYGLDVSRRLFVTRDDRLDTLTLEGSLFYYTISGLDSSSSSATTDSYTITPFVATGRYTYYYNEDFGIFAYGGFMKNIVLSTQNSTPERVSNLGAVVPAIGAGALLRVGPQWYTRIDAGLDMIAANLMIRF